MQPIEVGNIYRRVVHKGPIYIMCLPDNRWRYFDEGVYLVHQSHFTPEEEGYGYEFIHKKYVPQMGDIVVNSAAHNKVHRLVIATRFSELEEQFQIETVMIESPHGDNQYWWSYDSFIQKLEFVCNQEDINCFVPGAICSWHMPTTTSGVFDDTPVNHYLITDVKEDVSSDEESKYYIVWLEENTPETPKYPHIMEKWITEGRFRYIQHMDDV